VVVVDRRLVQVAVGVAQVGDRDGDHRREQEAVAKASAEDTEHADRQVGKADLGLEASVAIGEADFAGGARAVEEMEHGAEDRGDPDRHDHPPDENDFQCAGGAARPAVAVAVDRGADQRDRGKEEKRHGFVSHRQTQS
jgi:hypothetical protein